LLVSGSEGSGMEVDVFQVLVRSLRFAENAHEQFVVGEYEVRHHASCRRLRTC
jgi:hypothetical protein